MFNFTHITDACIKCGKCIPTCTIHQVNPDETTSPRGFLHLLGAYQRGELELDLGAKNIFESCFLCTNCTDVCPSSLPTDLVIEKVRQDIAKKYGIAWFKRGFFFLLRHRFFMDLAAKFGYVFRVCSFSLEPKKSSMVSFISLAGLKKGRVLPAPAMRSFLQSYPEYIEFGDERRVAIFIGCMANYAYLGVGESLLFILKTLKIDAFIPKKQLCCAAPAYFTGDLKTTKYLIKKNIAYFETFIDDFEAVLIPEATCSSMIIKDWLKILQDEQDWLQRAEKIVAKCHISTQWLYENTQLLSILKTKKMHKKITYHDPCHARKTQGVWQEPRQLLGAYELVEMSNPNQCCGFGGVTMQSEKYHLSALAGVPKAQMIEDTRADFVSAECSACRMQINNALHQNKTKTQFLHPLELIARSLK